MKKNTYITLGFTFILLQLLVIIRNMESGFFSFFWYCDFIPTILAFAFFMRNIQMIKGIINVGFFAQLGYVIITCIKLLFGSTLFGFVFDFPFTWTYILPTLIIHTSTMVAFIAIHKEKPTIKALSYSLLLLVFMYTCVLMFAKQNGIDDSNYNFIFYANILPAFPYYTELWIPLTFVLVVLPTQLFQYGVWRWGRVFISEIGTK